MRLFWIAPLVGLALGLPSLTRAQSLQPCPDWLAKEAPAEADAGQKWTFTVSPIVYHWKDDPEHKYAFVLALERRVAGNRFCGLSLFRNSFGQASAYLYAGQRWDNLWDNPKLSLKVSAGIIYGYTGAEADKVPLDYNGFSPAVIPSFVYQFGPQDSADLMLLGTAGVVLAYSHNF